MQNYKNRVHDELLRLSDSPAELGRRLGVGSECARRWLAGESLPSLVYLNILHNAGLDIMYIVTGERNDTLELALQDIPHTCETCGHYCDGFHEICKIYDYDCALCHNNDTCRTCRRASNWQWRGIK